MLEHHLKKLHSAVETMISGRKGECWSFDILNFVNQFNLSIFLPNYFLFYSCEELCSSTSAFVKSISTLGNNSLIMIDNDR